MVFLFPSLSKVTVELRTILTETGDIPFSYPLRRDLEIAQDVVMLIQDFCPYMTMGPLSSQNCDYMQVLKHFKMMAK